jgi:hypothetical protein
MSSPLAIAGVTHVLKDLLNNGLIDNDVTATVGTTVEVTALPPDRIDNGGADSTQLNLFLYQVTPNLGWRNEGLPSRDERSRRISNPPLALDLQYLLMAYGAEDLHSEILLGYAMHLLHEHPVIGRREINTALIPPPVVGETLPPALRALNRTGLGDQVEQIKITPTQMSTEEISKLWAAFQANYRPSAAYHVSVVLIEAEEPARSALPVLHRGPHDAGPIVAPSLVLPVPTATELVLPDTKIAAEQGDTIRIRGHHLGGTTVNVHFRHQRLGTIEVSAAANSTDREVRVMLPSAPADWVAGLYGVSVHVQRAGESSHRHSNELPMLLGPTLTLPPTAMNRANNLVTISVDCAPEVRPFQKASLSVGQHEAVAETFTTQTDNLTFVFGDIPEDGNPYVARLRIDDVDSWFIDRRETPPVFRAGQRITVPA